MDPATKDDIAQLRSSMDRLASEVSGLVGLVREEIGHCAACRPIVRELQHYVQVDSGIRENGSAGSLDTVVRSHERALALARRSLRWAISSLLVWVGTIATAALTWLWHRMASGPPGL